MIQVGQVLDKYELLERVGQGGMAVVYRALDRSLKRVVAVKVLHRHLADSLEARERFEREAHAVAKLRHDNILEIYAFGGAASEDSYIVTEFIDGVTLKQFITDHPLTYPELGAMVVLQIGRALAHAHAAGILHRDVKPENVMIRRDGVVKLTDFGISQMVDLQRMTVTGQLLGSPAYMAPEHVEGQPLDFRTDVFACGTVLYQLTVGELPFAGKNPHEILKRIAECKFPDPRQAQPRVGDELGKIILRAMSRLPADRYAGVGELVTALERYLTGSGLGPAASELARFFGAPASYEMALRQRLVDHLSRTGIAKLTTERAQALQALDRVLTLEPKHEPTLRALARIQGQAQRRRLIAGAAAGAGLLGAGLLVRHVVASDATVAPPDAAVPTAVVVGGGADAARVAPAFDARVAAAAGEPDAARPDARGAEPLDARGARADGRSRTARDATTPAVVAVTASVRVSPPTSEISVEGGPWETWPAGAGDVQILDRDVTVTVRNPCCETDRRVLGRDDGGRTVSINLAFLPATIVPRCAVAGVQVRIDGKVARLGQPATIAFGATTQTRKAVRVEFVGETIDLQPVEVRPGEQREVACALR